MPLVDPAPAPVGNRYIHPVDIGGVHLANNLCLAPMAGFTNLAFRLIAKEVGGCGLVATEMVAAIVAPTPSNQIRFGTLTANVPEEKPVAMQVYGREPEFCAQTAVALAEAGADIVDLNCGCPVRKAKQAGCGVALMHEPDQVGRIVKAMRAAVPAHIPVTVKMRLGYDARHRTAVEVALRSVDNGAAAVFVHARTGESKHGVPVDLDGLAEVRAALEAAGHRVPVFANGSMDSAEAIRAAKDIGGAAGYQIGRSACGDPWLFRNLVAALTGGEPHQPTLAERRALLERHFELVLGLFGEGRGVRVMRKYTFFYCNGLPGVRRFRDRFCRIADRTAFLTLVDDFFSDLSAGRLGGEAEHLTLVDEGDDEH